MALGNALSVRSETAPGVQVIGRRVVYLSSAQLNASNLADESRGTGFERFGTSVELSGAGSEVGSWHGRAHGGSSEESQGRDGSGGDGGELHFGLCCGWKTGVLGVWGLIV